MSDMTVSRFIDIDALLPMESFAFPFFARLSDIFTCGLTPRWSQQPLGVPVPLSRTAVFGRLWLSFIR
jgi:hypothetical protein